jgi:hypothetical protein
LGGQRYIRLCVLSFRSHAAAVDEALNEVQAVIKTMAKAPPPG